MDRRRPGSPQHVKQWSTESTAARFHHGRSASAVGFSTIKRNQNFAAKAAAQRLAQVMSSHTDDDDDDLVFADAVSSPRNARPSIFSRNDVVPRSHSPAFVRNDAVGDNADAVGRSQSAGKIHPGPLPSATSAQAEPGLRPPVIAPLRTVSSLPRLDPPATRQLETRFLTISGLPIAKASGDNQVALALRDQLDVLQERNDNMLEKLRLEEERCQEAEARARELEKQVASLREGVSLEAKLLSRKEAMLRQKEEELRNAKQSNTWVDDEVASLRSKVDDLKSVKAATIDHLHEVENEVKTLRSLAGRMVLTQKEMEEVVLKRCWLARYWGLAVKYGICEDAAVSKHEHWSSLAPLPFEIVLSAGQKAKQEHTTDSDNDSRSTLDQDSSDVSGEGNMESMLSVEMGLQELSSLKVEDAVMRALSQQRRLNNVRSSQAELGSEEAEDVLFKEAWLTYFWRRALTAGIEEHIASERLKFWKERSTHAPTSHDAVAVEQGLMELRKLGIERRLWTAPRKENGSFQTADLQN